MFAAGRQSIDDAGKKSLRGVSEEFGGRVRELLSEEGESVLVERCEARLSTGKVGPEATAIATWRKTRFARLYRANHRNSQRLGAASSAMFNCNTVHARFAEHAERAGPAYSARLNPSLDQLKYRALWPHAPLANRRFPARFAGRVRSPIS